MIPISHKLTQPRADGTVFKLYANERIIANYAAMTSTPYTVEPLAAQRGSAVQSPPHQEVAVPNDDLLSTKEAATILGYQSDSQVRQYIRDGRLAAVWVGGQYVIRRSVVEEFRQRHKFRPRKRR